MTMILDKELLDEIEYQMGKYLEYSSFLIKYLADEIAEAEFGDNIRYPVDVLETLIESHKTVLELDGHYELYQSLDIKKEE